MKVGRDKISKPRLREFSYRDIFYDEDGWADATKYLPEDFDLITMKMKNGDYKSGWSIGNSWRGARLRKDDEVLYWKRKSDERETM